MQKNKNILIDTKEGHKMLNGRRVVLEGLTVNHYQMYAGRSEGLSLLTCSDGLSVFSFIYFLLYIYYWVKFFDQWSNFFT